MATDVTAEAIHERVLERQRRRRASRQRLEFDPSPEVAAIMDALRQRAAGGDTSAVLHFIITRFWREHVEGGSVAEVRAAILRDGRARRRGLPSA